MCLGVPGRVIELYEKDGLPMGKVDFGGVAKEVCLAYTPEVRVDDYVLVHVGFAINAIDPAEAEEVFSLLRQYAEAEEAAERDQRPNP
ncbi:MAG TPA: HypC/HybG/HupF family hydrogenase formation chaperone [Thermoguttaceae bacterium]|nr:HypC/HybG/HupF family hydrogenase formation chaperone [Thermoguttaceae bacterium]